MQINFTSLLDGVESKEVSAGQGKNVKMLGDPRGDGAFARSRGAHDDRPEKCSFLQHISLKLMHNFSYRPATAVRKLIIVECVEKFHVLFE